MPDDAPEVFNPVEDCDWRTPRAILARHGFTPLPPSEVDDRQLPGRLWELLYAAAARRAFFHDTNHLSDRDLYTVLHEQWLDEPTADIPLEAETNTHLNFSEFNANGLTHEEIWLRYYAREDDRALWRKDDSGFRFYATEDECAKHAKDYPKDQLPPKEKPPCNRDWRLPKGPF
jgi:hypothetical protein